MEVIVKQFCNLDCIDVECKKGEDEDNLTNGVYRSYEAQNPKVGGEI